MDTSNLEVMIVDDNDLLQFLHETILSMAGLGDDVPAFDNGQTALAYLHKRPNNSKPVLVLLDINMPVMNGWEFLEALTEMEGNEKVFVAIVTSSVDQTDKTKSLNYPHVIDFLEKPITVESVESVLVKLNYKLMY